MVSEVALGTVADITMGQSPPGETYNKWGDGLPFFQGTTDFQHRHPVARTYCSQPSRTAMPGDILLSVRAPIGRINVADQECAYGRGLCAIRSTNPQDARFLEYALSSVAGFWTTLEGGGSVFGNATRKDLENLLLPWPEDPAVRSAIAHILGTLDDKIELNRRTNETLEAIARALFKSWFVDFDPVRAKAEGRDPGLPPELAALFPDSFVDSELGKIPSGWRVAGLDSIAKFLNGLALQKYPPNPTGPSLPVIKIAQLRAGSTNGADRASADLDADYVVNDGDVLFSWSGSLECIIWAAGRGALNQHLFKVTSLEYPKWFCYHWIHQHLPEFRRIAAGKATTMGHIQRHHLSEAAVVVPRKKLMQCAGDWIAPLIDAQWRRQVESRTLSELRDTLRPKLISGELRVPDAERIVGGSL